MTNPKSGLKNDVLKYFDQIDCLSALKDACQKYNLKIKKYYNSKVQLIPLRLILLHDFVQLADISEPLASLVLSDPRGAQQVFEEAAYHLIVEHILVPGVRQDQVQVPLRIKSIPPIPGLTLWNDDEPCSPLRNWSGLLHLTGILIAKTKPSKYMRSALYKCKTNDCPGSNGRRVVGYAYHSRQCKDCAQEVHEAPGARDLGDKLTGIIIDLKSLESLTPHFKRNQGMLVHFRDELSGDLQLGEIYSLATAAVQQIRNGSQHFELDCFSINTWQPGPVVEARTFGYIPPASLHSLFSRLQTSPWGFVVALASQLCSDTVPAHAFLHLKLGLLLSLASQGCHPIPILAVGPEFQFAHQLMSRCSSLARRHVTHGSSSSVPGNIKREDGVTWHEAGSLLLASGGICYMGDWAKYKKDVHSILLTAIESGQITLESSIAEDKPGPIPVSLQYPLKCAVWTYWDPNCSNRQKLDKDKLLSQLRPVINVFGMPYLADTNEISAVETLILQEAIHGKKDRKQSQLFSDSELREFLMVIRTRDVVLGRKAEKLIREYFVASRRAQTVSGGEDCLPIGQIQTLTALSEAHARLSMRTEVTYEDALAVVCLCEQAVSSLFSNTFLSSPPALSLQDGGPPLSIQVQAYMKEFEAWLSNYITTFIGEKVEDFKREE